MASPPDISHMDDTESLATPLRAGTLPAWLAIAIGLLGGGLVMSLLAVVVVGNGSPAVQRSPTEATAASSSPAAGTPQYEAPSVGYLAPSFILPNLAGTDVSLRELRGHPVWVNLWASWCGPCKVEMPEMKKMYAKYKDRGLILLGVDVGESRETVSTFVIQQGYDWTFLLDRDSVVAHSYNATGIPTHAFIDATGVIRAYRISSLSTVTMESYLAQILPR